MTCPLCERWEGELDLTTGQYRLCEPHTWFMRHLDRMLAENEDVLGRLPDRSRLELALSLEQMHRGEGSVVYTADDLRQLREGEEEGS